VKREQDLAYAHSVKGQGISTWEPLDRHLSEVSVLAGQFAAKFGAEDWGQLAGALHDIGKYSDEFQDKLTGRIGHVDHSTAGARFAAGEYGPAGRLLAYVIAGHHTGLANWDGDGAGLSTLERRLSPTKHFIPELSGWERSVPVAASLSSPKLTRRPDLKGALAREGISLALFARFLLSALVDADRLCTEAFYATAEGRKIPLRGGWQPLASLKSRLDLHMATVESDAAKDLTSARRQQVQQERAIILAAGRAAAQRPKGLFSLTVPTGGGKTLASLSFALDHVLKHDLDRIIYVIPFTSIIEQTARVFRDALGPELAGHVIEHHSAFREDEAVAKLERGQGESALQAGERLRLATENWDAPIIVTTAVQFFESLFSNRTSQCRKLHNIARSVIIMDEAQTLPLSLLRPTIAAIEELTLNYSATAVLCTATQPAVIAERPDGSPGFYGGLSNVREIIDAPDTLYERLRRVTVRKPRTLTPDELTQELSALEQVLCIVGTRAQARDLYKSLMIQTDRSTLFHLSALMCPAHRTAKLAEIKSALEKGPCRVVATTVVEAGVDIDFPVVWRQMAGLDSIAQAAGRCNREGRQAKEYALVHLFEVDGWKSIRELRPNEAAAREVLRHHDDPLGLTAMRAYFEALYDMRAQGQRDGLDAKGIMAMAPRWNECALPFADIANAYKLIETVMEPVIVPWDATARQALAELADPGLPAENIRAVARKLQPYIVNIPKPALHELQQLNLIAAVNPHRFEEQFMRLSPNVPKDIYTEDFGIDWSNPTFRRAEENMF
jgi:CRISPR-associated endonuclease/helicase Cas3